MELGKRKQKGQLLIGFAAESQNLEHEGKRKLKNKNLDLIAVNDISNDNTGFEVDSNQILLVGESSVVSLPYTSKIHTADLILDRVVSLLVKKAGESERD